jgi:hydrogenase maturation protease
MQRIAVIGLGNPDRADDAVGILVVRALRGRTPPDVALLEDKDGPLFVLEQFGKFDALILVDAVRSGAAAGTVQCFNGRQIPPSVRARAVSSHTLCVHDVLGLGEALGTLPEVVWVVGIEAARFEPGAPPSPEMERAVEVAAEAVLEQIGRISHE